MNSLLAWSRRNSNLNLSFVPPHTLLVRQRAVAARLDCSACVRCLSDPDAASPTLILSLTGRGGSHAIMMPPTARPAAGVLGARGARPDSGVCRKVDSRVDCNGPGYEHKRTTLEAFFVEMLANGLPLEMPAVVDTALVSHR